MAKNGKLHSTHDHHGDGDAAFNGHETRPAENPMVTDFDASLQATKIERKMS